MKSLENWLILFLTASKRERKQYSKRGSKPNKSALKKAAACLLVDENTAAVGREAMSDLVNLRVASKSPSLSTCSSSSSSLEAAEKSSLDEEMKGIEHEETSLFLNALLRIQEDYIERHQKDIKDTGLTKRLLDLNQNGSTSYGSNTEAFKQSVVDVIDSECQSIITWSRQIPDFEMLSIDNQTFLIEQNFLDVILIEFIWKTMQKNDCQGVVFNEYFMLDRVTFKELGLSDTCEHLLSIVDQLKRCNLTYSECMCLKVLALFKSQNLSDSTCDEVMQMRQKCFATLRKATEEQTVQKSFRYDSLLLLFSDIKTLSLKLMWSILSFSKTNTVEIPNLLSDMCTSQQKFYRTNIMKSNHDKL